MEKADVIAQLKRKIWELQAFKAKPLVGAGLELGCMNQAFPDGMFPTSAVHEFVGSTAQDAAAGSGFICGLLAGLQKGMAAWISSSRTVFPPALKAWGLEPDRIIFIDVRRDKDVLWAIEESLKCENLSAVVGELKDLDFTASRRLQLAVEQSGVTGFLLRRQSGNISTTACTCRWHISSLASKTIDELPGVGYPRWNVELLKVRNGKPGKWLVEWSAGSFHVQDQRTQLTYIPKPQIRKIG